MIERLEYTLTLPPSCPRKWDHLSTTSSTTPRFTVATNRVKEI